MYLIISYSKPVFWLSSYPKKPSILLFHFAFLLAISRGQNPGRDFSGWSSPTGSFRYEARPMRCFHYPPPRYSHRPSRWKSTYRMPWHSYLKILNFYPNSQNYCQLTRYLKYTLHLVTPTRFPYLLYRRYFLILRRYFAIYRRLFLIYRSYLFILRRYFQNDFMVFSVLYFPNPRKSHKSHR